MHYVGISFIFAEFDHVQTAGLELAELATLSL